MTTPFRRSIELMLHLAHREAAARDRFSIVGGAWPLVRQLAQLAVLVFTFSRVIPLGSKNYVAFVWVGLLSWTWFSVGLLKAATSVVKGRHFLFHVGFPAEALPVASVLVALFDSLLSLPLLIAWLAIKGDLGPWIALLPLAVVVQLLLMCGIAWLLAAATVYAPDVEQLVALFLLLFFYVTPVFYSVHRVPTAVQSALRLNPLVPLLTAYRRTMLDSASPITAGFLAVVAFAVVIAALGLWAFRRAQRGFIDAL